MNNKKGFSLAETVIALAVIVVVSITALTIVMSSIKNKVNIATKLDAQNFAYNALECFKVSSDDDGFKTLVEEIVGQDNLREVEDDSGGVENNSPQDEGNNEDETEGEETPSTGVIEDPKSSGKKYTYISSRGYTAEIEVNFTPNSEGLCSFSITIKKEEKNLVSFDYSKASNTSEG